MYQSFGYLIKPHASGLTPDHTSSINHLPSSGVFGGDWLSVSLPFQWLYSCQLVGMYTNTQDEGISYSEHGKNSYTQGTSVLVVICVHTEGWGTSYSVCRKVGYT